MTMKHTNNNQRRSLLKMQRDLDLTLAARRVRSRHRGRQLTFEQMVKLTLESPAPAYYVDPDYAVRQLSRLRRGILSHSTSSLKRQMWEELHQRTTAIMARHRLTSYTDALYRVLADGHASRFFISAHTAAPVLYGI